MDKMGSPFWKSAFTDPAHRCLIPLSRFAEGAKGAKTNAWFSLKGTEIFAWPGLWRDSKQWGNCYTGCMIASASPVDRVHDRMPLLLKREDWKKWLNADADTAMELAIPLSADAYSENRTSEPRVRK